jgi:hypothetical protein
MQGGWFHAPTASWECMTSCIRYVQKPLLIWYSVGWLFESLKNLPFPVLPIFQNQRIAGSGSLKKKIPESKKSQFEFFLKHQRSNGFHARTGS